MIYRRLLSLGVITLILASEAHAMPKMPIAPPTNFKVTLKAGVATATWTMAPINGVIFTMDSQYSVSGQESAGSLVLSNSHVDPSTAHTFTLKATNWGGESAPAVYTYTPTATNHSCYGNPTNPIAVAQQQQDDKDFVTKCFGYYLNRAPSAKELAYWSGKLDNCLMTNDQVQSGISALQNTPQSAKAVTVVVTNKSSQPLEGIVTVLATPTSNLSRVGGTVILPGAQGRYTMQIPPAQNYLIQGDVEPLNGFNSGECISRSNAAVNSAFPGKVISIELDDSLPGAWSNAPGCTISIGN